MIPPRPYGIILHSTSFKVADTKPLPKQLPGLFHAWYIIAKYPEPQYDYDAPYDAENGGGGRVYVFVHEGGAVGRQRQQQFRSQQPYKPGQPQPNMNYGTSNNQSHHSNQQQAGSSSASASRQPQQQPNNGGEGSSDAPPPSYAQVVAGDHKVQTQD